MAQEVLDVITKLTYEANVGNVDKAVGAIQKEIDAIDKEAASVARLETIKANTDKANITRINQINTAIDNRKRKIEQLTTTITKEIQVNEQLRNSLARQGVAAAQAGDRLDKLSRSSNSAGLAMLNVGRVAQDLPFGFLGIANNLNPLLESFQRLKAETGSTGGALKSLAGSLTGAGGLGLALSVVSSLLIVFGDRLFRTSEAADAANESYKAFLKTLASDTSGTIRAINEQSNSVNRLFTRIRLGGKDGTSAIKELREQFPTLTKDLTDADLAAGKGLKTILQQVKAKEVGNLASKAQVGFQSQLIEAERQLGEARDKNAIAEAKVQRARAQYNRTGSVAAQDALDAVKREAQATKDALTSAQRNVVNLKNAIKRADAEATLGDIVSSDLQSGATKGAASKDEKIKNDTRRALRLPTPNDLAELEREANDLLQLKKFVDDIYADTPGSLSASNLIGGGAETSESRRLRAQLEIQQDVNKKRKEDSAETKKQEEKNLKSLEQSYFSFRDTIIQVLNDIYDRQIQLLDQEIQVRSQRVEQAVLLAERGNTEILRQEQERLDEATRAREDAARKQVQLNALVGASNAALALTEAIKGILSAASTTAAEGGGIVGYIAGIVAGLAAVAALYSSIRTAADSGDGFKEGGYTGDGDRDEPAGVVHKGEFVFTKDATKRLGVPILEALQEGKALPYTANMERERIADREMYRRIDKLIEATEGNGVRVNQSVDGNGVNQLVETARRVERRKWR